MYVDRTRHRLQRLGGKRISFLVSPVKGSNTIVLVEETFKDSRVTISNVSRQQRVDDLHEDSVYVL